MSATNRGSKRVANDLYCTPSWAIRRFLEAVPGLMVGTRWLEPAAGKGNIITEVDDFYIKNPPWHSPVTIHWDSCDIDPTHSALLCSLSVNSTTGISFMDIPVEEGKYDVIMTNPPYSKAFDFVKKALEWQPRYVVMLLRVNFLSSDDRCEFMQVNTPDIYVLPNRPCFVNGTSDSTEYAWFVWDTLKEAGAPGKLVVLNSTSLKERKLG